MRAARFYGKKDIRLDDVPKPEPGPGQVLVGIEWAGICGSDLHEYIQGTWNFFHRSRFLTHIQVLE